VTQQNKWFVAPQIKPDADTRIFFFPYAGGGPSVFTKRSTELPDNLEAQIAHYPGRGSRHNEPPVKTLTNLVEELFQAIQPLLDNPYIFFGHSMGGTVAFELARSLLQNGLLQPSALFISACTAPQIPSPHTPIHTLPDDEFLGSLIKLGGIPNEILQNKELLELLLPVIRADFELIETYKYIPDEPLDCPIFAFGGRDDPRVSREQLESWAMQTNARFQSKYFDGDHFFGNTAKEPIVSEIASVATLPRNDE
jgi:medium-chain acyl-[acyl-carrier-protein] hydrolase